MKAKTLLFSLTAIWSHKALKAADIMEKEGVSLKVVNVSTLKPIDEAVVKKLCAKTKGIVTVEENSIIGGLGSAIAMIMRGSSIPMEFVAIKDVFGQSALDWEQLLVHYGLTEKEIVAAVKKVLK